MQMGLKAKLSMQEWIAVGISMVLERLE